MELITAVLIAGPLGFFITRRRRALVAYLVLWAVIFPIQTAVVFSENGSDKNFWYLVVNGVILCAGIGLNRLGAVLGERRRAGAAGAQAGASIKLHRCPVTFAKSASHPCWKVQKALDDAGIAYEVIKQPIRKSKRTELARRSGERLLPAIEFQDGRILREESADLAERIRSGQLQAAH